jgi:orotidine-5'-phosphate decarboxylase
LDSRNIIVALDYPEAQPALEVAARLDPQLCRVKVGKELFVAAGPALVERLNGLGHQVFLDLKFHDIPNTVAGACRSAARMGVWMLNVHASGGEAMMRAAREALPAAGGRAPLLIGVTILTSLADADMARVGFQGSAADNAERLARLAHECGLDGVVCSAEEAPRLRSATAPGFNLVTPGIRLAADAKGDQQRVVTPLEAVRRGADYLVVGRPVTRSKDPAATLAAIRDSLREGMAA